MSTTEEALTAQARALLARRTTAQLVQDWIAADTVDMNGLPADESAALATTRGWLMDALEERNPEAFTAWLDTPEMDNDSLRNLYLGASS